jgi:hypothetical protein
VVKISLPFVEIDTAIIRQIYWSFGLAIPGKAKNGHSEKINIFIVSSDLAFL